MNSTEEVQVHHRTVLDDEGRHAARVYAEAIYKAAASQGQVDELRGEFDALVREVFRRTPELELLMSSAAVSRERKQDIIEQALAGKASDLFLFAVQVLNQHDRLDLLRNVAVAYGDLVDRKSSRLAVQVRSAVPLTDEQRGQINLILREVSQLEPMLQESLDPALLGGLVVQVGDWVYDASVRTRIQSVRTMLIERSGHGIEGGRDRFST